MNESKLKASAQDSVGELPNLLLLEGGYPHLPDPVFVPEKKPSECKECKGKGWVFVGFGEDHECETCFDKSPESENIVEQSQPELTDWISGFKRPVRDGVYERKYPDEPNRVFCKFFMGNWYRGKWTINEARDSDEVSAYQHDPWRDLAKNPEVKS